MSGHDGVYATFKQAMNQVREPIFEDQLNGCDISSAALQRNEHRRTIARLRRLVQGNAKERELQNVLFRSGLLALGCRVIQEVVMKPTQTNRRGMRMDLVLRSHSETPSQIIELKRSSHLLLTRQGRPAENLSRALKRAIKQIKGYGNRVVSDGDSARHLKVEHGIETDKPLELRLIVGRRPRTASSYHALSRAEADERKSGSQLQICTWDGLLAELERIYD